MPRFTDREQQIINLLADGQAHPRREVHQTICDSLQPLCSLHPVLTAIRKKIRPLGQDIVCELVKGRQIHYRHVRILRQNS